MKSSDFSVVVPVYGGSQTIATLVDRIFPVFQSLQQSVEVILVDDASPDESWKVIRKIAEQYKGQIKAIRLAKNCGQQSATLCGIHHASGKWIVTIDDDLQHLPEEIPLLIARQKETGADMIYGIFAQKQHSFFRNLGSFMFNKLFALIGNTSGNGSSFRLINGEVCDGLLKNYHSHMLLDEVLSWHASTVAQINVRHEARELGKSGYSGMKLMLLTINYVVNYTVIPLRLMTYGGLISSFVTLCIGLYFIYEKQYENVELGFTSIVVAIFFSTSLILFSLGIIGEYISRMYVKDWNRPQYLIGEIKE